MMKTSKLNANLYNSIVQYESYCMIKYLVNDEFITVS